MSMNLGINVVEVDGATPSIAGAATSIPGLVIRSQRGVPGVVRQISNFTQFVDYFGGYVSNQDANQVQTAQVGAYAIRGFFDNGGAFAYVIRVVDGSAVAASRSFPAPTPPAAPAAPGAPPAPPPPAALQVTTAYRGQVDPGSWGNSIAIKITANTDIAGATGVFDVTVARIDLTNSSKSPTILETWTRLQIGGSTPGTQRPEVINNTASGSKFIKVTVNGTAAPAPTTSTPPGGGAPVASFVALQLGSDDTLSGTALDTALSNVLAQPSPFDPYLISLLACPESSSVNFAKSALSYCARRGDCMYVGHVPDGLTPPDAKAYGKLLQGDKVYGALYYPYIQVNDPIGTVVWIPPTGHVLGVYARTDQQRGVWKAPAGNSALVGNAIDVKIQFSDTDHTDLVKNGSVNAIRPISGAGIVIDSSRTLSTNTLWLYVNVRLLFNYVETSLKYGLRWVVQEPNDSTLWNKVKFNSVVPFLTGLWRRGAFGPGSPDDVFTVKVDAENNPADSIEQGILNIEVYFYPSRPAETIVITVGQQEGGASVTERR